MALVWEASASEPQAAPPAPVAAPTPVVEAQILVAAPTPVAAPTAVVEAKPAPAADVVTAADEWVKPSDPWIAVRATLDIAAARREAEAIIKQAAAVEPIFVNLPAKPASTPVPGPRLLPKVPFRFCLHSGSGRYWMQLEGGTRELMPDAVRLVDRWDNVVEERLCMRMRGGEKGHAPVTASFDTPAFAWVVVSVPNQIVDAYEAGRDWSYKFQARVDGEWLALDLVDSGCRLGSLRPLAAS